MTERLGGLESRDEINVTEMLGSPEAAPQGWLRKRKVKVYDKLQEQWRVVERLCKYQKRL